MVMGIFMAAMLVGLIYYVWGIGGSLLFRERMQDAADASAFSAAVIHARGMNILVLLNITMAAFAAIDAGLATASDGLDYALGIVALACLFGSKSACKDVPHYSTSSSVASIVYNLGHAAVTQQMNLLRGVAAAVRVGTPLAGQALVMDYAQRDPYHPTTRLGLMFPVVPQLAAEPDPTNHPCDERVYWPGIAIGGLASAIENRFEFDAWYFGGMGLAWALNHKDNARAFCPDYFQRVPPASHLGEEPFQVRTVMYGESPFTFARRGVGIATWDREQRGRTEFDGLETATFMSFAQAEYYYDNPNDDPHEDYLWHARWRARLRRFRAPSELGACEVPNCASIDELRDAVVH